MTDLETIKHLVRLQELFNRKREIQGLYRDPEQKYNKISRDYTSLSSTYQDVAMNAEEMDKKIAEQNSKLEEINSRISALEEGKDKIKIARQLKSWEKEMEKMSQEQSLLNAQIEYDSSKVEEMHGEADRINNKLEEQKTKMDEYQEHIEGVKTEYAEEIQDIDEKSLEIERLFEPQFSDYFIAMLTKTQGSAIVTVDEDSCTGCNIILPTLLQGDLGPELTPDQIKIHQCPHCFRYLYYEEWLDQV